MSNIYKNVIELIGKTPLVEVENVEKRFKLQARLLVKLDGYNPAGSAKDRIAYQMIVDAEDYQEHRHRYQKASACHHILSKTC